MPSLNDLFSEKFVFDPGQVVCIKAPCGSRDKVVDPAPAPTPAPAPAPTPAPTAKPTGSALPLLIGAAYLLLS